QGPAGLRKLTLVSTQGTDDGVQTLKGLTHLEELALLRLPMTDQGLGQLATLTGLKRLRLHEAKITAGGIAALKKAIPDLKVETDKSTKVARQPQASPKKEHQPA